jgi:hypothetical protein
MRVFEEICLDFLKVWQPLQDLVFLKPQISWTKWSQTFPLLMAVEQNFSDFNCWTKLCQTSHIFPFTNQEKFGKIVWWFWTLPAFNIIKQL